MGFELESYFDGTCPDAIEDTWRAVEHDYEGRISRELFEYAYDDYCLYNGMEPHFHAEELLYSDKI